MLGLGLALSIAKKTLGDALDALFSALQDRATYYENESDSIATKNAIDTVGVLDKATILLTPTATSDAKVHSVKTYTGDELVTNGTFDTDSDWILGTGWTISGGTLNAVGAGQYVVQKNIKPQNTDAVLKVQWTQTITSGTRLRFFARNYTDGGNETVLSGSATDGGVFSSGNCIGSGTYTIFVKIANGYSFKMLAESGNSGTVDNVSVIDVSSDFDFDRASSATRINSSANIEDITSDLARINYDSNGENGHILLEPTSTNLYLNSATLSTQDISTSATDYTISFYGAGTITFSGSYSGSLVGTGTNDRVSLTFTASSGTLTSTVSGSVTNAQAEALSYATSYIPTTSGTVTRAAETLTGSGNSTLINSTEGVLYVEMAALNDDISQQIGIYGSSSTEQLRIEIDNNVIRGQLFNGAYQANMSSTQTVTNFNKIAFKWKVDDFALWINGTEVVTDSSGTTFSANDLDRVHFSAQNGSSSAAQAKVKALVVFNEALTDTELQNLTS